MSTEPLVRRLEVLGFRLGKYVHPFGKGDTTKAADYTVFAEATDAEAEAALGRLVSESAELRAAVREFFKAEAAVAALYHPNGIYTDFYEAADIANAARENLRRLAASEGES